MAAIRPCMQSVMELHPEDTSRIDDLFQSYREAGLSADEAAREAVVDAMSSVDALRSKALDAVREQFPRVRPSMASLVTELV